MWFEITTAQNWRANNINRLPNQKVTKLKRWNESSGWPLVSLIGLWSTRPWVGFSTKAWYHECAKVQDGKKCILQLSGIIFITCNINTHDMIWDALVSNKRYTFEVKCWQTNGYFCLKVFCSDIPFTLIYKSNLYSHAFIQSVTKLIIFS